MKKMKNLLSLVLALVMVVAMSLTAMAETVDNETKHDYRAYQIFAGQNTEEGETTLTEIEWGKDIGVNASELLAALQSSKDFDILVTDEEHPKGQEVNAFLNCTTAYDVAKVLGEHPELASSFAQMAYQHVTDKENGGKLIAGEATNVELEAGYYLFVDVETPGENEEGFYRNLNLLQSTGGDGIIKIQQKIEVPSVDKEVWDDNSKDETGLEDGWGETADYNINETFQFKLSGTFGATVGIPKYKTYKVVFHDTLSKGISYDGNLHIFINDTEVYFDPSIVETTADGNGNTILTVTIPDIQVLKEKKEDGSEGEVILTEESYKSEITIDVVYDAHLTEDAQVVVPGLSTSDPVDGTNKNNVYMEYSNNPNVGGEGETGNTPDDDVWVFTYEMPNEKVDEDGAALAGAGFTVYDAEGNVITLVLDDNGTPEDSSDDYYRPVKADGSDASNVTTTTIKVNDADTVVPYISSLDDTGYFRIKGLDDGVYTLKETVVPAGYNKCADIQIELVGAHEEVGSGEKAQVKVTMKVGGNEATENVVTNKKGIQLPETGGIGTTIFYVAGVILVIVAGVLLVTKKRMSKEQ